MKATFTVIILLATICGVSQSFITTPIYQKIEVQLDDPENISIIASLGIDLQCGAIHSNNGDHHIITLELTEQKTQELNQQGFPTKVLIEDLSKYYADRAAKDLPNAKEALKKAKASSQSKSNVGQDIGCVEDNYPVPANFTLGSMGGFLTYQEFLADLDLMAATYPNLITVRSSASTTGITTAQGNVVYYVKVSDNPNIDENEAELLYTGLHHAREPMSMMNLQYYLWYLLENYNTDQTVRNIVDNTEMYFIPVLNPDGYIYNQTTNPNGGGFWRKNRKNNNDGSIGVDLNRNYGYNWGYDNFGSSPTPSSDIYRGPTPFSEAETQIVKEFSESHTFVNVFNNHSYTNLLIRPWGYDYVANPDQTLFDELGEHMCWHNRYYYGGAEIIYTANGDSDDWHYGEQSTKSKSLAFTPEIGSANEGGFWPSPSLIQPQCDRQMRMSLILAESATNHGIFSDLTSYSFASLNPTLDYNIQHMSLTPGTFTITTTSSDPNVVSIANPTLTTAVLTDTNNQTLSTGITLSPTIQPNTSVSFTVTVNNGLYDLYSTTISKIYNPSNLFYDDCSTMSNWTNTSSWNVDNSTGYNASGSITDSPSGNSTNGTKTVALINPVDLSTALTPVVEYYAKWEIAKMNSYVQFEISTNGTNWTELCADNMKPGVNNNDFSNGNSDQPSGEPIYDGYQESFVREQIDLTTYAGQTVYFRFRFRGDSNVTQLDGFWFDDFSVFDNTSNCPIAIIENSGAIINSSQSAIVSIDTDGSVSAGNNITYNAGDYIQLNPGFCTPATTIFRAIILACQ